MTIKPDCTAQEMGHLLTLSDQICVSRVWSRSIPEDRKLETRCPCRGHSHRSGFALRPLLFKIKTQTPQTLAIASSPPTLKPQHANYVEPLQYLQSLHHLIVAYFISNLLHSGRISDFSFPRCFLLLWKLHARCCLVQTVFYWPLWVRKQKFNPTCHCTYQKSYL